MSITNLAKSLSDAGIGYHIVIATPSTVEESHWVELLAKKLYGYLRYRGKQKQQFHEPSNFDFGGEVHKAIVFPLQEVFGKVRNVEDALVRLGVQARGTGKQLTSNRAISVLTWLLQVKIVLLEREASGGVSVKDAGSKTTASKAFFDSKQFCIGIPVLKDMHVELAYLPSQQTIVHELEHARDFYITGSRDSIGITWDELSDFRSCGESYYYDMPEVKARCKELAVIIKDVLADQYNRLVDAAELAHVDSSISRPRYQKQAMQISGYIKQLLRTPVSFSDWALSGHGSEFIPMQLPANIRTFVALITKARAINKNSLLHSIVDESRSNIRAKKALEYTEDFLMDLRSSLKAKYKPVIRWMI